MPYFMCRTNHAGTLFPRTVRLRDGRDYCLRPLTTGDQTLVQNFFNSLSAETIRQRYGYAVGPLSSDHARRLIPDDPTHEMLLGILSPGTGGGLHAMGRLVLTPDGQSAECALLVHDDKRHLGMASRLLLYLRALARRHGLQQVLAQLHRDNLLIRKVFLHQGARLHFEADADYVTVNLPIRPRQVSVRQTRSSSFFSPDGFA